jgi:hypothetical protein
MVQPRNFFLFSCHFCNASMQVALLKRKLTANLQDKNVQEDIAAKKEVIS